MKLKLLKNLGNLSVMMRVLETKLLIKALKHYCIKLFMRTSSSKMRFEGVLSHILGNPYVGSNPVTSHFKVISLTLLDIQCEMNEREVSCKNFGNCRREFQNLFVKSIILQCNRENFCDENIDHFLFVTISL